MENKNISRLCWFIFPITHFLIEGTSSISTEQWYLEKPTKINYFANWLGNVTYRLDTNNKYHFHSTWFKQAKPAFDERSV